MANLKATAKQALSTKYIDLLAQTDADQLVENRKLINETASLDLDGHMLKIKKSLNLKTQELSALKAGNPYTPRDIYIKQCEIDALNAEFQFMTELKEEQF